MIPSPPLRRRRRPVVDSATLFGRCLFAVRGDLGYTQGEFAELMGISRPMLTHIETGRTTPSFHVLLRLGQRVADERQESDATAVLALFHMSAQALVDAGVRVVNRPRRDTDDVLETVRIDRVVGRVFDEQFRSYLSGSTRDLVTFAGDDEPSFGGGDDFIDD